MITTVVTTYTPGMVSFPSVPCTPLSSRLASLICILCYVNQFSGMTWCDFLEFFFQPGEEIVSWLPWILNIVKGCIVNLLMTKRKIDEQKQVMHLSLWTAISRNTFLLYVYSGNLFRYIQWIYSYSVSLKSGALYSASKTSLGSEAEEIGLAYKSTIMWSSQPSLLYWILSWNV